MCVVIILMVQAVWQANYKNINLLFLPSTIRASDSPSRLIIFTIFGLSFVTRDGMPGHIFAC